MARLLEPLLPSSVRRLTRRALKEGSPEVRPEVRALATGEIVPVTGDRDMLVGRLRSMLETVSLPALLRYEDRNSMAFSLEARVPFLDSRLVEFAFSLPHEARISDGRTKAILRDALSDTLPPTVRDRQDKMGFVTPESEWFAGPLRSWAHDIVHSTEFAQRAYWDAAVARRMLADFGEGRKESASRIWRWVSLELWLRQLERSDWQFAA
jgi:asparagine synthase (glutamine-hydrolysing)